MSRPNILVIDDSHFTREAIAWALREAGYEVQLARDLSDLEGPIVVPDLVLMDVVLQDAFGDELAPLLRMSRGFACPIFLVSSLSDGELEQRVIDARLDGYVSKRHGLAAIVERVRRQLGGGVPGPVASMELASRFNVNAHQRLRRVSHVAAQPEHWNASAIEAEMQALAGDADLVGKTGLADAARECRDAARRFTRGSTAEIDVAVDELARLIGDHVPVRGRLLVLDSTDYCATHLIGELDWRGYVVIEARMLAEARPTLLVLDYEIVLVDEHLVRADATLIAELRRHLPRTPIAIVADAPGEGIPADLLLSKSEGAERLIDEIDRLLRHV